LADAVASSRCYSSLKLRCRRMEIGSMSK
jgi:hypothetical protein